LAKIIVDRKAKLFTLNGQRRQLRFRTSFKLLGYLFNGQKALAEAWLERCKFQGFDGVRFFGEYHFWNWETKNIFWGLEPSLAPYDLGYNGPNSHWELKRKHQKAIRQLVDLLVEYDMIGEYSVLATLKGHEPKYGDPRQKSDVVSYNSHALRVTADYLEKIGATNLIYELYNEYDVDGVHIPDYEMLAQCQRWKTRDLPGSLVGVSTGAPWNPSPLTGPTHYNIHTGRGKRWWELEGLATVRDKAKARPIFLNENYPYGTKEQINRWGWDAYGVTSDWARIQMQWNNAYNSQYKVAAFCVHDLTGMLTDPTVAESPMEAAHREQFGSGSSPPPPPPPPPDDILTGQIHSVGGEYALEAEWPKGLFPLDLQGAGNRPATPKNHDATGERGGVLVCRYSMPLGEMKLRDIVFRIESDFDETVFECEVYDGNGNFLAASDTKGWVRFAAEFVANRLDIRIHGRVDDGVVDRLNLRLIARSK
jgi:hypothetical protein